MKKKMRRGLIALIVMIAMVFTDIMFINVDSMAASSREGKWIKSQSGKWWYRNPDGTYPSGKWQQIDGTWYYFDSKGWMKTGWIKSGGDWFYLKKDGTRKTGWQKYKNNWYFFDKYGVMQTGQIKVKGTLYYMGIDGVCLNADEDITYLRDGDGNVFRKYYKGIQTSDFIILDSDGKIRSMHESISIDKLRALKLDRAEVYLKKLKPSTSKEGFIQSGEPYIFNYWLNDSFPPIYGVVYTKQVPNVKLRYGGKEYVRIYRLDTGKLFKEYEDDLKE